MLSAIILCVSQNTTEERGIKKKGVGLGGGAWKFVSHHHMHGNWVCLVRTHTGSGPKRQSEWWGDVMWFNDKKSSETKDYSVFY